MGNKVLNVEDEVSKKIKDYDSSIRNSLNEMKLPHTIDHNINLNPKHFSKNTVHLMITCMRHEPRLKQTFGRLVIFDKKRDAFLLLQE